MMNHKCPKCGTAVPEQAKFCPNCGTAQKKTQKISNKGVSSNNKSVSTHFNLIYVVLVLAVIVAAIYGYQYFIPVNNAQVQSENTMANQPPPMNPEQLNDLKARLEANPDGVTENIEMGNFLFDHQRYEEAAPHYEKALAKDPKNADVIVDAGVCYFNMGNLEKAKQYFQNAIKINDHHPNALYNLGVVSAQMGDMEEMLDAWKKLIEVAPESSAAQTAKRLMDQVKNSNSGG
jgi:tetratricopeptide (TPR) repeat protein